MACLAEEALAIKSLASLSFFSHSSNSSNYSAPPMGMSNRLTVVLQQELH